MNAYERRLTSKTPQRIVLSIGLASILLVWLIGLIARNTDFGVENWDALLALSGVLALGVPFWLVAWAIMARLRSTRELKIAAAKEQA